MPVGEAGIVADVVIVGGGPAGILLAHYFREHGIRHTLLERGKVAQSWRDMRPGMVLLSPGVPGTDWTSLTLERPIWSFPGVRRPFPTREDFLCYVDAFARDGSHELRGLEGRPKTSFRPQSRVSRAGELPRAPGSVGRTEFRHASPAYAGAPAPTRCTRRRGIQ